MSSTANFYDQNARSFFDGTVNIDMSELHKRFLSRLPPGASILDAGCGSGRDAKIFHSRGFAVVAFDASPAIAELATAHCGFEVQVRSFADVTEIARYDGVWACASLIHLTSLAIPSAIWRLWRALKAGGSLYVSFKVGNGEREHNGQHFTDIDDSTLRSWLHALPGQTAIETWVSQDRRTNQSGQWLNAIVTLGSESQRKVVTGGVDPFLPHLSQAIVRASQVDMAVAFIRATGLRLLLPDLHDALIQPDDGQRKAAQIRILTSDYLDVTDPDALRLLLLLQTKGAIVRVFESTGSSFHLKAYMFAWPSDNGSMSGAAFIGSSNISRQALQDGLEWNYRVNYPGDDGYLEARGHFEDLFHHPRTIALSDAWIEKYEQRRIPPPRAIAPGTTEQDPPPNPTAVQTEALDALRATREDGFRRGLVVMATGLGKTWLAAFDAERVRARRVLFVAHREEILNQAAETFLRIRPNARVGFYMGVVRDTEVDVLCASVQTLSRVAHLERFLPQHFDYLVIDEFHHAAASTYRRLLGYFAPRFLLGLTATPDRTDQSDILSLCDDNLVFTYNLFAGISAHLLAPFQYYGISDESVDYQEVPWRNGRFDPAQLSGKLATLARARHSLNEWRAKAQARTLAFCVSISHAEFMAAYFVRAGVAALAVFSGAKSSRGEALERLRDGRLSVVFSVDMFSEGVDLPSIDTVMMLRPTESKILFLQQLGRGLRLSEGKEKLVVLDFIGNHKAFLHKPQALFGIGATYKQLANFARDVEQGRLVLPDGCYVNYDLKIIEFLKSLDGDGPKKDYEALSESLGRRPTLTEFYRAGASVQVMRQQHGSWFEFVHAMGGLDDDVVGVAARYRDFLREIETTSMSKSFKMVLLEALQELDGWRSPPLLSDLAQRSWEVLHRRLPLLPDLPEGIRSLSDGRAEKWQRYWSDNPVNAWIGGNRGEDATSFFRVSDGRLRGKFNLAKDQVDDMTRFVQEVVDYRLANYEARLSITVQPNNVVPITRRELGRIELPFFPNLKIACGHFRTGRADSEEYRSLGSTYGQLDPHRHFIARASGDSMNGGKSPIRDGDYLLLELVSPTKAGSITGTVMAIERPDGRGDDNQYLLRVVTKARDGSYILKANNLDFPDLPATDEMRTLARLKAVVDPIEMVVGRAIAREDIPALFGETFNPGNWNVGHVVLNDKKVHVLLVTLNKQGKAEEHRYLDRWVDEKTFHWQSQNVTTPQSKRGREIIEHERLGIAIHLFVRETKLSSGKAGLFVYHGKVSYQSHTGSGPMSVTFALQN